MLKNMPYKPNVTISMHLIILIELLPLQDFIVAYIKANISEF